MEGTRSQEPGAGSREPEAEPEAGSREPGARSHGELKIFLIGNIFLNWNNFFFHALAVHADAACSGRVS